MKLLGMLWVAAGMGLAGAEEEKAELLYGHFEIHVDYDASAGEADEGWRFSTSYNLNNDFNDGTQVVRIAPEKAVFLASPGTETTITAPLARFGPVGSRMWVLPQNDALGTLYLGVRTTMPPGIFQSRVGNNYVPSGQGSISLRLVSVEGSGPESGGHFATWKAESLGNLVFPFDTTDGISEADEIPTIPATNHTHYHWGLTKPGVYRVRFEASGKLNAGNRFTSGRATFTFAVPYPGAAVEGTELALGTDGPGVAVPQEGVVYAPDRVLIHAPEEAGAWVRRGWIGTAGVEVRDGVGLRPETFVMAGEGKTFRVKETRGPGWVEWKDAEGGPLDMAEGIAVGAGERKPATVSFGERGIYRLTVEVEGASDTETATLVYGAGVDAGFGYEDWRLSFERAEGLAAGALADPAGDADGDGVANGVEFALFWHGFDPARPDGWRMPLPMKGGDGSARFDFLRDTWKDRLDESGWRLRAETSGDLENWTVRSSREPGFPHGIFETGAEEGSAWGRVMKRRLRATPGGDRAFFRFDLGSK